MTAIGPYYLIWQNAYVSRLRKYYKYIGTDKGSQVFNRHSYLIKINLANLERIYIENTLKINFFF